MPRLHIRTRTLLLLVALAAVGLFVARVVQDGVDTDWLALRLRFGDSRTRQAAADEIEHAALCDLIEFDWSSRARESAAGDRRIPRRVAETLLLSLSEATHDREQRCREAAMLAIAMLAETIGTEATIEPSVQDLVECARCLKSPEWCGNALISSQD